MASAAIQDGWYEPTVVKRPVEGEQQSMWLSNHIYPITFAWQTGVTETLENQLVDLVRKRTPAGGFTIDVFEQVDRMIENAMVNAILASQDDKSHVSPYMLYALARRYDEFEGDADEGSSLRGALKGSAVTELDRQAHTALDVGRDEGERRLGERPAPRRVEVRARPRDPRSSLVAELLRQYLDDHADAPTEIHLVGHSAGAIFLAHLIERLAATRIDVESLTYLAAAIRTDVWIPSVRHKIQHGQIKRFTAYGLNPARELDESAGQDA